MFVLRKRHLIEFNFANDYVKCDHYRQTSRKEDMKNEG